VPSLPADAQETPELVMAAAIPVVVTGVWWTLRRVERRLHAH
jgi:uncharacterized membrane-anchored protein